MSSAVLLTGGNGDTNNNSQAWGNKRGRNDHDHHHHHQQQQQRHSIEELGLGRREAQRLRAPAYDGAISRSKANKSSKMGDGTLGEKSVSYPPGTHLWSRPQRGAPKAAAVLPLPSPMLPTEWWRRPPSPLHWHMRPLWEGASTGAGLMSDEKKSKLSLSLGEVDGMPEQPSKLISVESAGGQVRVLGHLVARVFARRYFAFRVGGWLLCSSGVCVGEQWRFEGTCRAVFVFRRWFSVHYTVQSKSAVSRQIIT